MPAAVYVVLDKDADKLSPYWIYMIPRSFEDNYRGAVLAHAVSSRPSKTIYINDPTIPSRHNGEPRFEISTQKLVLSRRMRIQVPSSAKQFRHRSLSEEQADLHMRPYTRGQKLGMANFMFGDATIMLLQGNVEEECRSNGS